MSVDVGLATGFVAGAPSISSPCVVPLVPLSLAHLVGVGGGARATRRRLVTHALAPGRFDRRLVRVGAQLSRGGALLTVGLHVILGLYQPMFARIVGMAPWAPWEPAA